MTSSTKRNRTTMYNLPIYKCHPKYSLRGYFVLLVGIYRPVVDYSIYKSDQSLINEFQSNIVLTLSVTLFMTVRRTYLPSITTLARS